MYSFRNGNINTCFESNTFAIVCNDMYTFDM